MNITDLKGKMHIPPEYVKTTHTLFYIFLMFCVSIGLYFSYWFVTNPEIFPYNDSFVLHTVKDANPKTQDATVTENQTLTGSLMEISEDKTYIRVSVKEKGVFSIGLDTNTTILLDGVSSDMSAFGPLAQITVVAEELPDTEKYDFIARSIANVPSGATASIDLRTVEQADYLETQN
jgi:hypothetical protein